MILAKVRMSPAALSPGIYGTGLYPEGIFLGLSPKRSLPGGGGNQFVNNSHKQEARAGGKENLETPGRRPQEGGPGPDPTFASSSQSLSQALQGHLHQEVFPWFSISEPSLCPCCALHSKELACRFGLFSCSFQSALLLSRWGNSS